MRGAYAKRFSGDAPPVVALFSCFLVCLRVIGVCLSRRPRRAAPRVTGGDSRPSAQPPTCIKDKHTPNCHLPFFRVFFMLFRLVFLHCFPPKKAAFLLPLENGLFVLRYAVTEVRKAVRGNLRVFRQSRKSNVPTPSRNCRFPFRTGLAR